MPGGGNCAADGRNPALFAPEKAANSAFVGVSLTTPTPPTTPPPLNRGTPPGLTAFGSLSLLSAFPVMTPRPVAAPLIDRAGLIACPGRKVVLSGQPPFVFSIPQRSAGPVPLTPGGKCMPLMNRTVREDS